MAAYLITSPQANMIGLYYLPMAYAAHETGIKESRCRDVLGDLIEIGFCSYDESAEVVWVHEAVRFQHADTSKADKQRVGSVKQYEAAPQCSMLGLFYDRYQGFLPFSKRRDASPSQALHKPFASPSKQKISPTDTRDDQRNDKRNLVNATINATSNAKGFSARPEENGVSLSEFSEQLSNAGITLQLRPNEHTKFSLLIPVAQQEIDHALLRARESKVLTAAYVLGVMKKERERSAEIAGSPAPPGFSPKRRMSRQEESIAAAIATTEEYNARVRAEEERSAAVVFDAGELPVPAIPKRFDAADNDYGVVGTPTRPPAGCGHEGVGESPDIEFVVRADSASRARDSSGAPPRAAATAGEQPAYLLATRGNP
jgi:hypothetical protein